MFVKMFQFQWNWFRLAGKLGPPFLKEHSEMGFELKNFRQQMYLFTRLGGGLPYLVDVMPASSDEFAAIPCL